MSETATPPLTAEVPEWRSFAASGQRIGPADAPVTIVEFSDFQCPFCAVAAETLRDLRERFGDSIAIVYRHFPLTEIHPHATAAAIASECAAEQGRFEAFHDALFASQDSIGRVDWTWFASRAGLAQAEAFENCIAEERTAPVVARDEAAGRTLGVAGTPTLLVNDRRLLGRADGALLDSLVSAALARSTPR